MPQETPPALPLGGDFALSALAQISLPVQHLARAVGFYHDRLRLPLTHLGDRVALFDLGGIRLALTLDAVPEGEAGAAAHARAGRAQPGVAEAVLYFHVDDIRAAYQALVERGVRFPHPPQVAARLTDREVWMVFFRDSENNLLALTT